MRPSYFELTPLKQRELLLGAETRTGWNIRVLEKDIWVVWTLGQLFLQPDAPEYAFKGGTSLSKVYDAIHRFSEDVDVTIDPNHPSFFAGLDPTEYGVSLTQLRKRGEQAREKLPEYVRDVLKPYFEKAAEKLPDGSRPDVRLAEGNPANLRIHYPSVLAAPDEPPYVQESVLLEFGARASTEPSVTRTVTTYAGSLPGVAGQLELPIAEVQVMKLERTFWEKATLIHFENTRDDRETASISGRYARHWYDLHQLSLLAGALNDYISSPEVLKKVLHVKNVHYRGRGVNYSACGSGGLSLVPSDRLKNQLERDYREMIRAGMFTKQPPAFDVILSSLRTVEQRVNSQFSSHPVEL